MNLGLGFLGFALANMVFVWVISQEEPKEESDEDMGFSLFD